MSWGYKKTPGRAECMAHQQREAPVTVPATTPLPGPAFFLLAARGTDLGHGRGLTEDSLLWVWVGLWKPWQEAAEG